MINTIKRKITELITTKGVTVDARPVGYGVLQFYRDPDMNLLWETEDSPRKRVTKADIPTIKKILSDELSEGELESFSTILLKEASEDDA